MSDMHIAALLVASVGCVFDLRTRRIPNWLTFGSAALALGFRLVTGGLSGVEHGMLGWATGMAVLLAPFLLGGMGAGDVKLVAALGAWLGPGETLWMAIYTSMAGAVMALIVSAWQGYLRQAWSNVWLLLTHWRVSGLKPFPELTLAAGSGPRLAFAVPILAGTLVMLWLQ
jgi:prepilin peptidase CpaA